MEKNFLIPFLWLPLLLLLLLLLMLLILLRWFTILFMLFILLPLIAVVGWLSILSPLSESESLSFESLDDSEELSTPIYIYITKAKLISRELLNFFLHLDWKLLTSSIAIWWDCCCCCCICCCCVCCCCCRCWVDIALDAFGICMDDDDDDVEELLLLLLFLLYITDDCGWLLAKLSSSKLGILGKVDVLLLAFHLLNI